MDCKYKSRYSSVVEVKTSFIFFLYLLDAGEIQCGISGDRKRKATTTSNIFYNLLLKYDLFNENCTVFTYLT